MKIKKFKIVEITKNKFGEFYFSDSVNIISANNKYGKSTFIKSLMFCLGFEIKEWAVNFDKNNFIFMVTFLLEDKEFEILRFRNNWIVNSEFYDKKQYRNFLNNIFKIKTKLNTRKNVAVLPYPSDLFLFNYVDQDNSFHNLFRGNQNKDMYNNKEIYNLFKEYIGILDKEISDLKFEKEDLTKEKKEKDEILKILDKMILKYSEQTREIVSLKLDDYKEEIIRLEKESNDFFHKRNKLEHKKYEILNKLKELDFEQIQLEGIYDELERNNAEVHCKFCNSLLKQTFSERYQREMNKNSLILQYADLKNEIEKYNNELEKNSKEIEECEKKLLDIRTLFNETKKNLSFSEIINKSIDSGIKKELLEERSKKEEEIKKVQEKIKDIGLKLKDKEKQNKEQEKNIINFYENKIQSMKKLFPRIDFSNLENHFMNFENKKTGSDKNITSVVIYYIYFSILTEFSKINFPIIWDTFIKEVLDKENSKGMENLVNNEILKLKTQIICSNVPDSEKEVKILNIEKYNVIKITDKLCSLDLKEKDQELLSYIYKNIK